MTDDSRVTKTATYEMLWDCSFCGTEKLLGHTHRFCPACGAPQDPDKRYFPPAGEEIAVANHDFVGADRVCEACSTPNSADAENCGQCGAPLTEAARARLIEDHASAPKASAAANPAEKKSKKPLFISILAALGIGGGTMIFWTEDVALSVTGHAWERTIRIEDFQARQDNAWCDAMPRDAYDITRKSEVRSHKQVPDGEECSTRRVDQGDGTFRTEEVCQTRYRREPIYDDQCYFRVNRWAYLRSVTANANDHAPYWPEVQLQGTGQECLGCERQAGRNADYYLELQSKNDSYRCEVAENVWQSAEPASRWQMEVGAMMGEARCGSLQPAP